MGMAGWDANEMMSGLPGIMSLAAASGEELALVSDIVTDGLTSFGLSANESSRFADVLAQAANASNTNVSMMGESFKYVGAIAGAMGYSIEDVAVALGTMANAGIKSEKAGTALRNLITNMANPTEKMQIAMDKLGVSLTNTDGSTKPLNEILLKLRESMKGLTKEEQAQYSAMLAGKQSMAGLLAIANATDEEFNSLTDSINNSSGAAEKMSKIKLDNVSGDWTLLKSSVEGAGIAFGEVLAPKVRDFLQSSKGVVDALAGMSDGTKSLLINLTGLGLGFGATLVVMGTVLSTIGKIQQGLAAGKLVEATSMVSKLSYGFKALAGTMGMSTAGLSLFSLGVGAVIGVLGGLIIYLSKSDERLRKFNEEITNSSKESVENVKGYQEEIKTLQNGVKEIQDLEKKISKTGDTEKRRDLEQQILDKKTELITLFPQLKDGFDKEAEAIDNAVSSANDLVEKNKELIAMEQEKQGRNAIEFFSKKENKEVDKYVNDNKQAKQTIADTKKQLEELKDYSDEEIVIRTYVDDNGKTSEVRKTVGEIRRDLNDNLLKFGDISDANTEMLNQQLIHYEALEKSSYTLSKEDEKRYEALKKWKEESANETYEGKSFGAGADSVEIKSDPKKIEQVKQQTQELMESMTNMSDQAKSAINNMIADMENGTMTVSEFETAFGRFTEVSEMNLGKFGDIAKGSMDELLVQFSNGYVGMDEFTGRLDGLALMARDDFQALSADSQQSFAELSQHMMNGRITAEEFSSSVNGYLDLVANSYNTMCKSEQDAVNKMLSDFSAGKMSASDFQGAIEAMAVYSSANFDGLDSKAKETLNGLVDDFNNGKIGADDFTTGIARAMGVSEKELARLSGASAKDLGKLVSDLLNGKSKAEALQSALASLESKKVTITTEYKTIGAAPGKAGRPQMVAPQSLPPVDNPPSQPTEQAPAPTIDTYSVAPMSAPASTPTATPMSSGESTDSSSSSVSTFATSKASNKPKYTFTDAWYDPYKGLSEKAKKDAQEREKAESDANSAILSLRNKLYEALKNKIEKQKKDEMAIYDARIEAIQKEMALLDKQTETSNADKLAEEKDKLKEYNDVLTQLQKDKDAWSKNDSVYSQEQLAIVNEKIIEQQKAIEEQQKNVLKAENEIKKEQLQGEIDKIEEEKKLSEEKFEQKLQDEKLYAEANKMVQKGNMKEITDMIAKYSPEWGELGILLGGSLVDGIKEEVKKGLDGYNYLKPKKDNDKGNSGGSSGDKGSSTSKKAKVTASALNVREGAGTKYKVIGSVWKGETVSILDSKNGFNYIEYLIDGSNKKKKGWVSSQYLKTFATGGYTGDWTGNDGKIAMLHKKERVLSSDQTESFDKLIYDWIPRLAEMFSMPSNTNTVTNEGGVVFNNNYSIENRNNMDARMMQDDIEYTLKKQLKSMGKKI